MTAQEGFVNVLSASKDNDTGSWLNEAMRRIATSLILLISLALPCAGSVSTNVPLDHWSYDAVDKLANYGLIDSAMLTIKPISRIEMARHIAQARRSLDRSEDMPDILSHILRRLEAEFRGELIILGTVDDVYGDSFVKPVEDPYFKYLYAKDQPNLENLRGDVFDEGSNYRAGFATRIKVADLAAFYLHPEFNASSESDSDVDLIEAYSKVMAGPFEIQTGMDSLWWGPAHRGSVLMSNNAKPLKMVKVTNPHPVPLPWILRPLGPFRAEWFLAQLEEDRAIPEAMLSGVRVNFKPHPLAEVGLSRVSMFGGQGRPSVGIIDYAKLFLAGTEQVEDNQLAGFDASLLVPLGDLPLGDKLPLRSVKLYVDGAGEDEGGFMPSKWGWIFGAQLNDILKTGRTDLRFEYADNHVVRNPNVFYNHGIYTSGYTYEGRVMGHYMGTDSRDVFVQLRHYLTEDIIVRVMYDHLIHNRSGAVQPEMDILQCDLTLFKGRRWQLLTGYRYEDGDALALEDNHVFHLQLIRDL